MSRIRSRNTRLEVGFLKKLSAEVYPRGFRYRKHYSRLAGKPDIVFIKEKVAVFLDGDFWHGHNWKLRGLKSLRAELASYKKFWANKIRNNVKRDIKATRDLRKAGWKVLRFWESDLKRRPDKIIKKILSVYHARKPAS